MQAWQLKASARKAAAAAAGDGSDPEDAELEQLLAGVMEGDQGEELEGFLDDYKDSDDGINANGIDRSDEDEAELPRALSAQDEWLRQCYPEKEREERRERKRADKQQEMGPASSSGRAKEEGDEGPIPSFSQVDLRLPMRQLHKRFPLFPGLLSALKVELEVGEMLYLPAGWFHEVTSFGAAGEVEG